MTLPVPDLDDRRFQDLVDEAKRLIPEFCPEWTNHNLSDPGVALIELFAWMSEMVLFRVNQLPDALYTRFLNLVGIEPFPASPATVDLTFWLAGASDQPVLVPAGTTVGTDGESGPVVVFTTTEDLVISQPRLAAALVSTGGDSVLRSVWDDLTYGGVPVPCFVSDPLTPGDALCLGFESSLAGNAVQLTIDASIEGIGVDPADPPLAWEVWGGEAWLPTHVHEDTTGGLNRRGTITLLVPLAHEPLSLGDTRAFWLRARLTPPSPGQPAYQSSPRIRSVRAVSLGGTVAAEHSEPAEEEILGVSDGTPDQRFVLRHHPVLPRRRGEAVRVVQPGGVADTWIEVPDFSASERTDTHVTWDATSGEIRFGPRIRYPDGSQRQHGAIPPAGAEITVTSYRHGGGLAGNVGAGRLIALRTSIPYIDRVENLLPATGGVDAESVDNAKARGPQTIRSGERAVTAGDFERLARGADPAVARARCLRPDQAGGPVRVLLVPHVDREPDQLTLDDFALPDRMVASVSAHLDERRILGTTVEIGTPFYQGVTVAALMKARPGRPEHLIRQRALATLYRYVNPFTGGADGAGWPFDSDLNATTVLQLLSAIDGVERVDEVVFHAFDLRNGRRYGPALEMVRLASDSLFLSARHRVVVR